MPDYIDEEDYQEFVNDLIEPFSDAHDDDVAFEAILLKIAALYGPLDHLIFDDDEGEAESITVTFNYRTRTFSLAADRVTVAPDRERLLAILTSAQHAPMETHDGNTGECLVCPVPAHMLPPDEIVNLLLASGVFDVPADPR